MKHLPTILLFLLLPLLASTQCYPDLKAQGQALYARQQYDDAIRHYLGALNCPDRPSPERDAVPDLIKTALQARVDQLNAALDQVEEERQKTEEALAQANKLIDAFYFYADRFALAFKNNQFYLHRSRMAIQWRNWGDGRVRSSLMKMVGPSPGSSGMIQVLSVLDTFGNSYSISERSRFSLAVKI